MRFKTKFRLCGVLGSIILICGVFVYERSFYFAVFLISISIFLPIFYMIYGRDDVQGKDPNVRG